MAGRKRELARGVHQRIAGEELVGALAGEQHGHPPVAGPLRRSALIGTELGLASGYSWARTASTRAARQSVRAR